VGCASDPNQDPRDPWEPMNRRVNSFNDFFDRSILKPTAEFYHNVMPAPAAEAVTNFFNNLGDVVVLANDLLQLKLEPALQDGTRIVYNTTFGLGGLFDVASAWDIPKHNEDFGQTLGYWGVGPGPYVVIPFLGPKTVRDTVGYATDTTVDPIYKIEPEQARLGTAGVRFVDTRTSLLGASRVLDEAALDPYAFMRDAYLQRRASLVRDGQPSSEEDNPPPPPPE